MRVGFSKGVVTFGLVLFFGVVSVLGGSVFVSEEGMSSNFLSSNGNAGVTQNVSYDDVVLVIEDGIVVGVVNGSGGGEVQNNTSISSHATLGNGLVAYYSLDGDVEDELGNYDGTNYGAMYTESGKVGGGYDFDGVDDYVDINAVLLPTGSSASFAISGWFYEEGDGAGTLGSLLSQYSGGQSGRSMFGTISTQKLRWWTSGAEILSASTYSRNQWVHFAFVRNGSSVILYLDGSLVGSGVDSTAIYSGESWMGGVPGNYYFNGKIDEMGIWSRALTSGEVSVLYNNGNGLSYE